MRRLLVLLVIASPATAAPPFPGGVLDTNGRVAYLASEAGIDAVDGTTGKLLWQTREARTPLVVAEGRLFAVGTQSANQLTLVAFDLKRAAASHSSAIDLPRWASARTAALNWAERDGELLLTWRVEARGEAGPPKRAAGRVRVDLDTGHVRAEPLNEESLTTDVRLPFQLEKHALRWHGRAAGQLLAVVMEELPDSTPEKRRQRFVFRSWSERDGKESPPRELLRGERLMALADLDGKHVWLRDAAEPDDASRPHVWSVVSALDGHLIARVPALPGTTAVTRIGGRAYCLVSGMAKNSLTDGTPRRVYSLHAIDLDRGDVAWTHRLGAR